MNKPCLEPRCPHPATHRGRCPIHHKEHGAVRIYGQVRWQRTRRHVLHTEPLCRHCGDIATDVDHITPVRAGGEAYTRSNLQPLCHACHAAKTRADQQ